MTKPSLLSTRVLLTCAAIGVATGLVSAAVGYLSVLVVAAAPIFYGLLLGSHVLPGVIAQALLRAPGVALVTHVLAALVSTAFAPQWLSRYIGTALLVGLIQEGISALSRYRSWATWRFVVSAVIVGIVLAVPIAIATDITRFAPWALAVYLVMFVIGPVVWTLIGLQTGSALRRAGVARPVGTR